MDNRAVRTAFGPGVKPLYGINTMKKYFCKKGMAELMSGNSDHAKNIQTKTRKDKLPKGIIGPSRDPSERESRKKQQANAANELQTHIFTDHEKGIGNSFPGECWHALF